MGVLVTGGSGFLGRFLLRRLSKCKVNPIKCVDVAISRKLEKELPNVRFWHFDLSLSNLNSSLWKKVLSDVDIVYHLAGLLGTTELFHRISEAERVNVLGTINLLEAMRMFDVGKIVFMSKPLVWKYNVYTITKKTCEMYLRMYQEIYGFDSIILRPYNVYGPEERIEHYRKAVPYFIISALRNEPIEIFGTGEQTMDLIHVKDCVQATLLASKNNKAVEDVIELGSGEPIKVIELANIIIELTESRSNTMHLPMRKGENENSLICADTRNMREILGFTPRIDLKSGLTETIRYYRENLDKHMNTYKLREGDFNEQKR